MMNKKSLLSVFIVIVLMIFTACGPDNIKKIKKITEEAKTAVIWEKQGAGKAFKNETPEEDMTIDIFDVGQGESVFIDFEDYEILIDGGNKWDGQKIAEKIRPHVNGRIENVICTHSHADHCGGLIHIYREYDVSRTIYGDKGTSKTYQEFQSMAEKEGIFTNDEDQVIKIGENAAMTICDATDNESNTNNNSVICHISYMDTSILITGDAEEKAEACFQGVFGQTDIVVAGHHGSGTSNSLIYELMPEYFVISAGKGNVYGHPHYETLDAALSLTPNVYMTSKDGDIKFITDGKSIKTQKEYTPLSLEDAGDHYK